MTGAPYGDFVRYLKSKTSVDDRALHPRVWSAMAGALTAGTARTPLRVVEAGAGIGTMIVRLIEHGVLAHAIYHAVEADAGLVPAAMTHVSEWVDAHGWSAENAAESMALSRKDQRVHVRWHAADFYTFAEDHPVGESDLVLAHAFLDLVDVDRAVPRLLGFLRPGGVFCFTLTFDGLTAFLPEDDPPFERELLRAYHRTMDHRTVGGEASGHSQSGRQLIDLLRRMGIRLLEAGPSDWLVLPANGLYPKDEAYFLHFIVETVRRAVPREAPLDPRRVEAWAATRHDQIDRGELTFMAHQWDVLGTRP